MKIIIAYDIASTHRRTRLTRLLKQSGDRIQFSVFECELTPQKLVALQNEIAAIVNTRQDRVHFYPICQTCFAKATSIGAAYDGEVDL